MQIVAKYRDSNVSFWYWDEMYPRIDGQSMA